LGPGRGRARRAHLKDLSASNYELRQHHQATEKGARPELVLGFKEDRPSVK
jgi:hypothetical protein